MTESFIWVRRLLIIKFDMCVFVVGSTEAESRLLSSHQPSKITIHGDRDKIRMVNKNLKMNEWNSKWSELLNRFPVTSSLWKNKNSKLNISFYI